MIDDSIYRVCTYHGTQMIMAPNGRLMHRRVEELSAKDFPVYARKLDGSISLFSIRDNRIVCITDLGGGATSSSLNFTENEDGSISIVEKKKFWSARLKSETFDLRSKKLEWECFTLDRAEFELTSEFISPLVENFEAEPEPPSKGKITPSISVIIPMYNVERYIEECLNSLLNQTFQDFEVLVVDDRSKDRSPEIVEGMMNKFGGRLTLIRLSKNSGEPGTPRNVGLNVAVGKYVYFMDSDDMLTPDALEMLFTTAERFHADTVYSTTFYRLHHGDNADEILARHAQQPSGEATFIQHDVKKRLLDFINGRRVLVLPWQKFVRRRMLTDNGIVFPPTYAADDAGFSLQCFVCAKVLIHVNCSFYIYRILKGQSISHKKFLTDDQIRRNILLVNKIFDVFIAFIDRMTDFDRHPEFKYETLRHWFRYCVDVRYSIEHWQSNPASMLYNIALDVMSDGVCFSNELIAMCFAASVEQDKPLAEKDRRIEALQAELNRLQSESNQSQSQQ